MDLSCFVNFVIRRTRRSEFELWCALSTKPWPPGKCSEWRRSGLGGVYPALSGGEATQELRGEGGSGDVESQT